MQETRTNKMKDYSRNISLRARKDIQILGTNIKETEVRLKVDTVLVTKGKKAKKVGQCEPINPSAPPSSKTKLVLFLNSTLNVKDQLDTTCIIWTLGVLEPSKFYACL
jgi:hypothetical protein